MQRIDRPGRCASCRTNNRTDQALHNETQPAGPGRRRRGRRPRINRRQAPRHHPKKMAARAGRHRTHRHTKHNKGRKLAVVSLKGTALPGLARTFKKTGSRRGRRRSTKRQRCGVPTPPFDARPDTETTQRHVVEGHDGLADGGGFETGRHGLGACWWWSCTCACLKDARHAAHAWSASH